LAEVTLTYSSGNVRFPGDQPKPITVTGAQLARVLEWMARNAPGRPHAFAAPDILASRLRGLGRLCGLAAQAEAASDYPEDFVDALTLVEDVLVDYGTRIEVHGDAEILQDARVSIKSTPKTTAAAA